MGGGTSKFDTTDWTKADGLLKESVETIDGAPPTKEYQTIFLIKKGINQREFDIVDSKQNLLYTTKAVPGTLAWFDVLGPASCSNFDDLLLRVQVDLVRRTWIVYRYHKPVFEGQAPATLDPRKGLESNVSLYKSACITVSWSRYIAIAARYGPPSMEYFLSLETTIPDEETTDNCGEFGTGEINSYDLCGNGDDLLAEARKVAARRRAGSSDNADTITTPQDTVSDNGSVIVNNNRSDDQNSEQSQTIFSTAVAACQCPTENTSPEATLHPPDKFDRNWTGGNTSVSAKYLANTSNKLKQYWSSRRLFGKDQGEDSGDTEMTAAKRREHACKIAMEGIIDLDGPLVECQEIYNRIIGNHQTSLIGKERVMKLLSLDEEQHHQQDGRNAESSSPNGEDADNPFVQAIHQEEERSHHSSSLSSGEQKKGSILGGVRQSAWVTRLQERMNNIGGVEDSSSKGKVTSASNSGEQGSDPSPIATTPNKGSSSSLAESPVPNNPNTSSPPKWLGFVQSNLPSISPFRQRATEGTIVEEKIEVELATPPVKDLTVNNSAISTNEKTDLPNLLDEVEVDEDECDDDIQESSVGTSLSNNGNNEESTCRNEDMAQRVQLNSEIEQNKLSSSTGPAVIITPTDITTSTSAISTSTTEAAPSDPKEHNLSDEDTSEPLIGYWSWKHGYTVYSKVELHLAQNSDLALHVVLAILCNQVRYERNALAMTV